MSNQVFANKDVKLYNNIMTNSWTAIGQVVAAGTPTVPIEAKVIWTSLITPNNFDNGNFTLVVGTTPILINRDGMYSFCANLIMNSAANGTDIEPQCYARITRAQTGQDFITGRTQYRCVAQSAGVPSYASSCVSFVQVLTQGDIIEFYANSASSSFHVGATSSLLIQRLY